MLGGMSLKERILQELMDDLDSREGEKLKPKEDISVMTVGHDPLSQDDSNDGSGVANQDSGDGENDDDLRRLLEEYSK